jgi:membrane protein implicated in regulation of membrane protease activity
LKGIILINGLKKIPLRAFGRYLLMILPGTAALALVLGLAHRWFSLPMWLVGLFGCLWVLKELLAFPFVWESYDTGRSGISGVLTGARGIVVERLSPKGRILVKGENWKAECIDTEKPLEKGVSVRVMSREGLTLFVKSTQC